MTPEGPAFRGFCLRIRVRPQTRCADVRWVLAWDVQRRPPRVRVAALVLRRTRALRAAQDERKWCNANQRMVSSTAETRVRRTMRGELAFANAVALPQGVDIGVDNAVNVEESAGVGEQALRRLDHACGRLDDVQRHAARVVRSLITS